jgi:hypothetical protein
MGKYVNVAFFAYSSPIMYQKVLSVVISCVGTTGRKAKEFSEVMLLWVFVEYFCYIMFLL